MTTGTLNSRDLYNLFSGYLIRIVMDFPDGNRLRLSKKCPSGMTVFRIFVHKLAYASQTFVFFVVETKRVFVTIVLDWNLYGAKHARFRSRIMPVTWRFTNRFASNSDEFFQGKWKSLMLFTVGPSTANAYGLQTF